MPAQIDNTESLKMNQLNQHIEALIFCSEQSISVDEIAGSLKISFDWDLDDETIIQALQEIKLKYASEDYPFCLEEISEGYQFLSKKEFHATISALIQHKSKKKLSISQMETLAIIAYKQPITKSEVEHIRGVNCDYAIHKLLEKEMVSISGKSDAPGRPVLYSTSKNFMDYFGIQNPKDLPQLKDLHMEQNEIGTSAEYANDAEAATPLLSEEETAEVQLIEMQTETSDENNEEVVAKAETELNVETEVNVEMGSEELPSDPANEMPPVMGTEEDMILPDRKAIFIGSQSPSNDVSMEESSSDEIIGEDDSEISS